MGVLALVVVYVFVYLDYTQRTEELEKSNSDLRAVVNELEEYNTNLEAYEAEIEEIKAEIESIMDEYPADAREEDALMLAVELGERNIIDFDAINMEEKESVYTIEPQLVTAAAIEGLDESLVFTQKHAVYVNQTTYTALKTVIAQIYELREILTFIFTVLREPTRSMRRPILQIILQEQAIRSARRRL